MLPLVEQGNSSVAKPIQPAPVVPPPAATPDEAEPKTAVVVIHGMGEQRPMETLWGFVQAAWVRDPDLVGERNDDVYSKPDSITGSFELRRITTRDSRALGDHRVDFFEFYWAHLMTGNTATSVLDWAVGLLVRGPSSVPARLWGRWLVGLALLVVSLILVVAGSLSDLWKPLVKAGLVTGFTLVSLAAGWFTAKWLAPVAGDAARYLSPTPDNVAARQAIREAGVDLLQRLQDSGRYDRIVIAGHSLGSVIGYDVLNVAWGRIDKEVFWRVHPAGSPLMKALGQLEQRSIELIKAKGDAVEPARRAYRDAQRTYFELLSAARDDGKAIWLVSDFVTLGSPLSAADVLVAKDDDDFKLRKAYRELPTSPPWLEKLDPPRFSFDMRRPSRSPHQAAVFAPTVWTNIFFEVKWVLAGDPIGGAVAPLLGWGVRDVSLPSPGLAFRHLDYWTRPDAKPATAAVIALRRALNLRRQTEDQIWGAGVVDAGDHTD